MSKSLTVLFGVIILFSGCFQPFEENIYENSEPSIVIEAQVDNESEVSMVKISKGVVPTSDDDFDLINTAVVRLTDNSGGEYFYQPLGDGVYYLPKVQGEPNTVYSFSVLLDSVEYKAVEKMPPIPEVFSSKIKFKDGFFGEGYYYSINMDKKKDTTSYYKVQVFNGDSLYNDYSDLLIFEDSYSIGVCEIALPYSFEENDTILVKIYGITKNMFNYYQGLSKQTTDLFSSTQPPMLNPPTNFTNDPLGYFQAASLTQIQQIMLEGSQGVD